MEAKSWVKETISLVLAYLETGSKRVEFHSAEFNIKVSGYWLGDNRIRIDILKHRGGIHAKEGS